MISMWIYKVALAFFLEIIGYEGVCKQYYNWKQLLQRWHLELKLLYCKSTKPII